MSESRKPDRSGIKFMYLHKGKWIDINHVLHPAFADFIEQACKILASIGVVEIVTLGITNNRCMRGMSECPENTSMHAPGLWPDYKEWGDGHCGARAIDIVSVEFKNGLLLTVHTPTERAKMVEFCEALGATVQHRTVGSVKPDHLHVEV